MTDKPCRASEKQYLYSPGPTDVPPYVLQALGSPITHHRSPVFSEYLAEVWDDLKYVYQTKQDVYMILSSATGAMEASVSNLLSPGDEAIVIRGGKFGERWGDICTAYGVKAICIDVEWGQVASPEQLAETLKANPKVKAVYSTLSETSTGVCFDIEGYAKVVRDTSAVLVCDATSGIGATPLLTDEWGVDVVVSAGHKALMIPPGLAFISVSDKAWKLAESSTCPKYYLNLKAYKKNYEKQTTPYTPAVNLVMGVRESLKAFRAEGYDRVMKRHQILGKAGRAAAAALGLEVFPKRPFDGLTALKVPEGIDGGAVTKKFRVDYGMTIAGGQDHLKGKIFRISHMGYSDKMDVPFAMSVTEMVLKELGYSLELGKGVAAAQQVILDEWKTLGA
ncbi:MAG: aminotransferase class V-fold PLP-dependent enzyme [bacterium]|nr:aminotransferase class V-fold PLP-dependent enzyme [bacterium]